MLSPRSLLPQWELGSGSEVMPSWCKGLSCLTLALCVSSSGPLWCCRAMAGSLNANSSTAAVTAPRRAVLPPPYRPHKTPGGVARGSLPLAVETAAPGGARRRGDAVPGRSTRLAFPPRSLRERKGEGRGWEGRGGQGREAGRARPRPQLRRSPPGWLRARRGTRPPPGACGGGAG